jgi:hypothetical protein
VPVLPDGVTVVVDAVVDVFVCDVAEGELDAELAVVGEEPCADELDAVALGVVEVEEGDCDGAGELGPHHQRVEVLVIPEFDVEVGVLLIAEGAGLLAVLAEVSDELCVLDVPPFMVGSMLIVG